MSLLRWAGLLPVFCLSLSLSAQIDNIKSNVVELDSCSNWLRIAGVDLAQLDLNRTTWFLISQASGGSMNIENNDDYGSLTDRNGMGDFEVNQIDAISGDTIFPVFQLRHQYPSIDGIQSAAVYIQYDLSGQDITEYTPDAPDELLFLPAEGQLTISTNIDMSGFGFGGGAGSQLDSDCGFTTNANNYFYAAGNWRGARKGAGPSRFLQRVGQESGRGPQLSAGGGGNDHNTGGGGGGHLGRGGNGAENQEPGFFNCDGNSPGLGGYGLPSFDGEGTPLLYLGGGGGAGHANNTNESGGGDGGGAIVVYANTLEFSGNPRLAATGTDGRSVEGDGGGGGGAGGSIFLLADTIRGAVTLDVTGGNGGNADNNGENRCFGPGGGGAGGRVLSRVPLSFMTLMQLAGGQGGESENSQACAPGENQGEGGTFGRAEVGDFVPQSVGEFLELPEELVYQITPCAGTGADIGFLDLDVCFDLQWFLVDDNGATALTEGTLYTGVNTNQLLIDALPAVDTLRYQLRLTNSAGRTVAASTFIVPTSQPPLADFTYGLSGNELTVTENNSLNGETYQWDFGDGTQSAEERPVHEYAGPGMYIVTLIVTNACGSDTTSQIITVTGEVITVADFTTSGTALCLGDTLFLINNSQNTVEVIWTLSPENGVIEPDGDSPMPFLVPTAAGNYNLQLIAIGEAPESRDTISQSFVVTEAPDYSLSLTQMDPNYQVIATGNGGNNPFFILPNGDTIMGTELNAPLPPPGEYTITFVAPDAVCGEYREQITLVISAELSVNIGAPQTTGCLPFIATFYNESSGPIESVAWEFPDGGGLITPIITNADSLTLRFDTTGTFDVRLLVTGPDGTIERSVSVQVDGPPSSAFTFTENDGLVNLTNISLNAEEYSWDFGDGNSSNSLEPTNQYDQSGTYSIVLITTNGCGSDTLTQNVTISGEPTATASFSLSSAEICLGDTIFLSNNSLNATGLSWTITPANATVLPTASDPMPFIVPTLAGDYDIRLIATGTGEDNRDTVTQSFNVDTPADYTVTLTQMAPNYSLSAIGAGGASPFFILPNGDTIMGTEFTAPLPPQGEYIVTFVAPNNRCGEYREQIPLVVGEALTVSLRVPVSVGCRPFTAWFVNESEGPIESIAWEYAEAPGQITPLLTNADSLILRFDTVGTFVVRLLVTGPNGTVEQPTIIEVANPPVPVFSVSESEGLIELSNMTQNATTYGWSFGDGNGSTEFEPSHRYSQAGTYEITLNVGNGICSRAVSELISVTTITSTNEFDQLDVTLYPNPASDRVFLEGPGGMTYQVFDAAGRALGSPTVKTSDPAEIDVSNRAAGSYWVRMFLDGKIVYRKLIIGR